MLIFLIAFALAYAAFVFASNQLNPLLAPRTVPRKRSWHFGRVVFLCFGVITFPVAVLLTAPEGAVAAVLTVALAVLIVFALHSEHGKYKRMDPWGHPKAPSRMDSVPESVSRIIADADRQPRQSPSATPGAKRTLDANLGLFGRGGHDGK